VLKNLESKYASCHVNINFYEPCSRKSYKARLITFSKLLT